MLFTKGKFTYLIILFLLCSNYFCSAQTGIWEELYPTNSPSPRLGFGMAEIGDGKVIIFGGMDENNVFDETWIYDFKENNWTEIKNDIHPGKRKAHRMARITKDKVLMFGGESYETTNSELMNDTWIFNLGTLKWTEKKPVKNPLSRYDFVLSQISDGKVLLFGGDIGAGDYVSDTWIYDIQENNWINISTNYPYRPPPCANAIMAQIDAGKTLFYGGWQFQYLTDTWLFNLLEQKWIKIEPLSNPGNMGNSSMSNINKSEVVFWGGDHDGWGNYDELWLFDLNDSSWKNIHTNIKPDGRFLHQIVKIEDNKLLLFGGYNNRTGLNHNDTWLFTLQPNDYKEDEFKTDNIIKSYIISDNENKLKIKISNVGTVDYQFYDIFGNKLLEKEVLFVNSDNEIINVDVRGFPNGLYFFITHQNNNVEVAKVLISR
ncbi:MAG: hypothetical protein A2X61_15690 [Ignavibacteria bacterium GWB2_35_12]|nr:MAG: hypothetical protein A2X61_15690 [Ignavibacteria bacterium GWB2_35_12]OGU96319.1 MAG: hypothetical protein A2220_02705 [Ignavibacteria bacterium RIFOXYA2_FULL_35_10]OGV24645.1 MAG: hypothetical protein A2475_14465 [Ignavibacteria bacterium RIFOXYC2_FULL_35_21]